MLLPTILAIVCLVVPVDGSLTEPFAPVGYAAGHWGVDIDVEYASPVAAPIDGMVTFAGSVAGMRTVTITDDRGAKVSLSYLESVEVAAGEDVFVGDVVGRSGLAHGRPSVHLSVRIDGRYVDPEPLLGCGGGVIRLLPNR